MWDLSCVLVVDCCNNFLVRFWSESPHEFLTSSLDLGMWGLIGSVLGHVIDGKGFLEVVYSHIEDTIISWNKLCLLLEVVGPSWIIVRPWTVIAFFSPWVSHFDEPVEYIAICSLELLDTKECVCMFWYEAVMFMHACCGQDVSLFISSFDDFKELIGWLLLWVVHVYWHACQLSQGLSWISSVEIWIVDIKFSICFF